MLILYVNLARSPERRTFMEAQAARLGVGMTRLEAADGRAIPEETYRDLVPETQGRGRLGRGELACFLSHAEAWRIIAEGPTPFGAVFEDDVYLSDEMAPLLADASWIPAGAAVVKLTANSHRFTLAEAASASVGTRGLHRVLTATIDSGGYVISAAHARKLAAGPARYAKPVDRFLMDPDADPAAALYQMMPAPAVQSKFADFHFLDEHEGTSLVQREKPARARRSLGATLAGETRNLWAKVLRPRLLPLRRMFTPKSRRVIFTAAPFRR